MDCRRVWNARMQMDIAADVGSMQLCAETIERAIMSDESKTP